MAKKQKDRRRDPATHNNNNMRGIATARSAAVMLRQNRLTKVGLRQLATSSSPVSTLNTLIETTKDSSEGFKTAAQHVKNDDIRKKFQDFAQQRESFCRELQEHVSKMGGTAETSGSTLGSIHRGWLNLKSALTTNDKAIISEVVNGETVAEKYFAEAEEEKSLPQDVLNVVQRQHHSIQDSLNFARDLTNRL